MFGFKLIQQSNMVILSCLAKKNRNLNLRKKSSVYYWKGRFVGVSALKMQLSVINWTFFPQIQILIFLREATQNDHIRLLYKFETEHFFFGCVGSCGYAPASVKTLIFAHFWGPRKFKTRSIEKYWPWILHFIVFGDRLETQKIWPLYLM